MLSSVSVGENPVSDLEWQARQELAAAYRLMDHFGANDMSHNHMGLRVPGEPDAFLIKPDEEFFGEVTASSLIKYDFEGNPRQPGKAKMRGGGLVIHAGILAARPDINATIHTHAPEIAGVASQKHGLLPLSQHAMYFMGKVAYHDFGGFEFDLDMRAPLLRDLEGKMIALLRNHGSLVCDTSIGSAVVNYHRLLTSCQIQVAALSAGVSELVLVSDSGQSYATRQRDGRTALQENGGKNWQGMLRLANKLFPDYRE